MRETVLLLLVGDSSTRLAVHECQGGSKGKTRERSTFNIQHESIRRWVDMSTLGRRESVEH